MHTQDVGDADDVVNLTASESAILVPKFFFGGSNFASYVRHLVQLMVIGIDMRSLICTGGRG